MAIPLPKLLERVPKDTFDRVDRTRKRVGALIRETLRRETGLLLNRQESSPLDERHETVAVPVSVVAGLPGILNDFNFDDDLALLLEISPFRRDLEQVKIGLNGVRPLIEKLAGQEAGQRTLQGREKPCRVTLELATELVQMIERADPIKRILGVNEDVLGTYGYRLPRPGYEYMANDGRVELYWGVIGLISGMLGVTVEALAAVTLIHELAHAYTHLGADIDGGRWATSAFAQSEPALKEGLAQYYTALVSRRVDSQIADTHKTYQELLTRQPDDYRTHLSWIEDFTPEEVRLAMIRTRRSGAGRTETFVDALREARNGLRGTNW